MKIRILPAFFALIGAWFFLTNAIRNPNNPPTGRTGAPGETTCATTDCHGGGNYTGTVSISGVPDTVVPGQTYTITLTNTSNAVRAGFQLTCLDASNTMCGTLVASSGVSIGLGNGRRYARQSTPKLLNNGSASWNFTWKAPASASGNAATFYFVSLCANNNGNNNGDNVLQSTKSVVFPSLTSAEEPESLAVAIYPTPAEKVLFIDLAENAGGNLTVMDMQGKQVMTGTLSAKNELNIERLAPGAYLAVVETQGKTAVKKFMVK